MWSPIDSHLTGSGIVAFSGGADSTALLHWIWTQRARLGTTQLKAVYIDHGLRPESGEDGECLRAFCATRGIPFLSENITVASGASLESHARKARYAALEEIRARTNASWVATGHTRTDLAHTVLMRILRGTGTRGLAAIKHNNGSLVRPLLQLQRKDTERYCKDNELTPLTDLMNQDSQFTRVQIRKLWKRLESFNPKLEDALTRLSSIAEQEREALEWAANQCVDLNDTASVNKAPDALLAIALKSEAEKRGIELSKVHTDSLVRAIKNPAGTKWIQVPDRNLKVEYGKIHWENQMQDLAVPLHYDSNAYEMRVVQQGDSIRLKRLKGHSKKVSRLFIDSKVPLTLRNTARTLIDKASFELVWVEHLGPAEGQEVEDLFRPLRQN